MHGTRGDRSTVAHVSLAAGGRFGWWPISADPLTGGLSSKFLEIILEVDVASWGVLCAKDTRY